MITVTPVATDRILPFREFYKRDLRCQIVHDSAHFHEGCCQSYLLESNEEIVGYGSTWVGNYWMPIGSVFEFYVFATHRSQLFPLFKKFLSFTESPRIHAQTNDPFLGNLIRRVSRQVITTHILFSDRKTTRHPMGGATLRKSTPDDLPHIFQHLVEPVGEWLLETDGRIVGTGGVLYHYNRPFGDIFMEVHEDHRGRGLGRLLVQELKKICYQSGSVPAARTSTANIASQRTLVSAGFAPCAHMVYGCPTFRERN